MNLIYCKRQYGVVARKIIVITCTVYMWWQWSFHLLAIFQSDATRSMTIVRFRAVRIYSKICRCHSLKCFYHTVHEGASMDTPPRLHQQVLYVNIGFIFVATLTNTPKILLASFIDFHTSRFLHFHIWCIFHYSVTETAPYVDGAVFATVCWERLELNT